MTKIRSFLAFDIPDAMKKELSGIIEVLAPKAKGIKWVDPQNIHCTLKFFGDVEEGVLLDGVSQTIMHEVKSQAPFSFHGMGLGVFPNWRYPRVIWAGLTGDTEAAASLHMRLEDAFTKYKIPADNRQAFRMHLTIGRVKSKLKDPNPLMSFVEKQVDRAFGDFNVDKLTLYKSVLTKEGPIYTSLKEFPFGVA
jgi:2'-5' RNA ligase